MVNYDKNSFLSGIAVGRQLKGWGTVGGGPRSRAAAVIALVPDPATVHLSAGAAPVGEWGDDTAAVNSFEEVQI